ncbi:hypothetical protein FOZ61_001236 [Perkinsus olseni]|uniref:Uncharacterized protein n=1 Tax=Perkinsus olseni TaxID=32597 RepID=A0A7J6MF65_PEROL|nr:hypothetical protein FOZ61_001236 [Perkinsus olseni]KAF4675344.1 hypothetical protein FOL46_001976 [Perkinsus olseni]
MLSTTRIRLRQGHPVITTSVDPGHQIIVICVTLKLRDRTRRSSGPRSLSVHFLFEAAYNFFSDYPHRLRGWFFRVAGVEFTRRLQRTVSPLLKDKCIVDTHRSRRCMSSQ